MKDNKGFTLLEVVITLGILSVVLAGFMTFFTNEMEIYYSKDNEIELKQDARIALDRVTAKIRSNNGLSFTPGPDGTGMVYKGADILINTTKNDINGEINYSFDHNLGFGEIKDLNGNKIVGNIKDFKLEKVAVPGTDGLIKITISCINDRTTEAKDYTTSVRMYSYTG